MLRLLAIAATVSFRRNPLYKDGGMVCTSAPYFSFLERCRYTRPRETELNPLDKGKSFSRTRYIPSSEDIDLLVDRPESCVDL